MERCEEYSLLLRDQCGHCLGHELSEEYEAVSIR